jgi:hypothetical protein
LLLKTGTDLAWVMENWYTLFSICTYFPLSILDTDFATVIFIFKLHSRLCIWTTQEQLFSVSLFNNRYILRETTNYPC